MSTNPILDHALACREAGLSTLPILLPEKRPAITWSPYMGRIADEPEVREWFKSNYRGLGIVSGSVSGNLFLLDIDAHGPRGSIAERYIASVKRNAPGLLERLYIEKSKGGGLHIVGRCTEPIGGGLPLARYPGEKLDWHGNPKPEVWIELKGERNQFVTAPTPGYTVEQGSHLDLSVIDAAQFDLLLQTAADLNEYTPSHTTTDRTITKTQTDIPADLLHFFPAEAYAAAVRANLQIMIDLLAGNGWKRGRDMGSNITFTRPGKDKGTSATLHTGTGLFYVFSSSTDLDSDRAYSPAGLFCELECGGDWRKTIEVLDQRGYGNMQAIRSVYDEIAFRNNGGRETGGGAWEPDVISVTGDAPIVLTDDAPAVPMPEMPDEYAPVVDPRDEWRAQQQMKPATKGGRKLRYFSAGEALDPLPPIEWVLQNILRVAILSALVGGAKLGKSFVCKDLAVSVADGRDWQGHKVKQTAVVYLDEENGEILDRQRTAMVMRGHCIEDRNLPLYVLPMPRLNFNSPADRSLLIDFINERAAGLVILDSFIDALSLAGAKEAVSEDQQRVLMNIRDIAETTGAAFLIIHHENRNGTYRGSSALPGAVDLMLSVKGKPGNARLDFEMELARSAAQQKFSALLNFGTGTFNLSPAATIEKGDDLILSKSQEFVMRYLLQNGASKIKAITLAADTCTAEAARRAVYSLANMNKVYRTNPGDAGDAIYDRNGIVLNAE